MAKILEVKDLCKTYVVNKRQNNILVNVNFDVEEGAMIAIMGPSGSGKSTLLYAVSGMDRPTSGTVKLTGKDITGVKDKELSDIRLNKMGFVFQQMYMMKNLTVLDNIVLPAIQSKEGTETKAEKLDRAIKLMKAFGIEGTADNDINEVSGGQLQRACICRSMINNPDIIFADEPTGALNRTSSKEVMDAFVQLNSEGTTIMMVTHDAKVAARCSKVLYIVDGNIKGEYNLGKCDVANTDAAKREREINNWLMEMGW